MENVYLALADLILITHAMVVLFIVGGFALIWFGYFEKWNWIRNFYFRVSHLLAMGFVAVQTVLDRDCPLTIWENELRIKGGFSPNYEGTFVGHWLGKILFFEIAPETFAILYMLLFVLIAGTLFWVKPQFPRKSRQ